VPRTQATASPEAAELVSAAVAVLGIYLIVEGLASFLGFALMAGAFLGSSFTGFLADHVARSAGSALRALAGLFLFLYADRVGGFLRRRSHHGSTAGKGAA
jgi:hypothetical protein